MVSTLYFPAGILEDEIIGRHGSDPETSNVMADNNKSSAAKSTKTPTGKSKTSKAKAASNRRNAQRSTGPKTSAGKAASSRNSKKHGMTTEPDKSVFNVYRGYGQHVAELEELIKPRNVIERQCVKEIAAAMFRLDQVKISEPALMQTCILDRFNMTKGANQWLQKIDGWWHDLKRGHVHYRPGLADLDEQWDLMTTTPHGACALHHMLVQYWQCLRKDRRNFNALCAQKLAWLLGEGANRLNSMGNIQYLDPRQLLPADCGSRCSDIDMRIACAMFRDDKNDEDGILELTSRVEGQLHYFKQVAEPLRVASVMTGAANTFNAARLMDTDRQDLLLRYDKAASNKYRDAVRMLCELRGMPSFAALLEANSKVVEPNGKSTSDDIDLPKRNGILKGNDRSRRNAISQN